MDWHRPVGRAVQAELALDFAPALEVQMRELFNSRWRRWHRAASFEVAMEDEVTRRLLVLAVMHLPSSRKKGHR